MKGHVYAITCGSTGMQYVGLTTTTIAKRFSQHLAAAKWNKGCWKLGRAIKKYGPTDFSVRELETCEVNLLNDREIHWISTLDTFNNGLNLTTGGKRCCLSKATKKKMSLSGKAKTFTCEHKFHLSEAAKSETNIEHLRILNARARKPVVATNLQTGHVYAFSSRSECAKFLGVHPRIIITNLCRHFKKCAKNWSLANGTVN